MPFLSFSLPSTLIHTRNGQVIDIEGNPKSPINEGTLCPKGANTFQLHHNPHRVKHVMWRAPHSDHWEIKSLDWAMRRIAKLVKETRDQGYREYNDDGARVNPDGGADAAGQPLACCGVGLRAHRPRRGAAPRV